MAVATAVVACISWRYTGSPLPKKPREALVFQNALLLIVLGSALLEHHYTRPADSVVNSLMGLVTLMTVYDEAPRVPWLLVSGYCSVVFLLGTLCVAVSSGSGLLGWRGWVAGHTYRPAVILGSSRVLFSIVFIAGLWFFYSVQDRITLALVLFWGVFIVMWPLRIPELLTSWFGRAGPDGSQLGEIVRIDSPNILRVALDGTATWDPKEPSVCVLPNGETRWVQPLYAQFQEGRLLATGLVTEIKASAATNLRNCVTRPDDGNRRPSAQQLNESLGGGQGAMLVGFVVEGSSIGVIRFETLEWASCRNGMLAWVAVEGERIYYQVVSGETREESFSSDKHGFQVASAAQLGVLVEGVGFKKYDWLPGMNTPVFSASQGGVTQIRAVKHGDFELGSIPNSTIQVGGNFADRYNYHTALLGVTGSGKTELAFDMIRYALKTGIRVMCIDLTAQYEDRLSDLNPIDLSIDEATAADLNEKLFRVETGKFGASDEKRALGEFAETLRQDVSSRVARFLEAEEGSHLGLIRLEEISNTKASLWITELYMTCLLKYARERARAFPRTLVVVEEAHTVMPEPSTMGLGDYDSRALVGKIAQIALQGRKFGVGLLVLAQRTATVSKTVLTQCNTIISFTCYDDTSLGFLGNIFGPEHVALVPNLPPLHAVAFGSWIRSEKPIVFQIPYDESKDAGAAKDVRALTEPGVPQT